MRTVTFVLLSLLAYSAWSAEEPKFADEGYVLAHMDSSVHLWIKLESGDKEDVVKIALWNENSEKKTVKVAVGTSNEKDKPLSAVVEAKSRKDDSLSFPHAAGARPNGSITSVK